MQFQAKFEFTHLKPIVQSQYLLFDITFPKLHARPIGPLLPQLISHVVMRFPQIPRTYFTFVAPDGLPLPIARPVVIVLDRNIPTDLYARALSQHLALKDYFLLSIGSFSNRTLSSGALIRGIMEQCKSQHVFLLVIIDELLAPFTIPAIIHYAHVTAFIEYYVIVNEALFSSVPLISNSIVVRVAKPCSISGSAQVLAQIPTFRREAVRWEFPLIYLGLLLAHRDDFPIKFHQVLPSAAAARALWETNTFADLQSRDFWMNTIYTMWRTMTDCDMTQKALRAVLAYFFRDRVPSIPAVPRIDFENNTLFSSEFPPVPGECGRVLAINDYPVVMDDRPSFGWKDRIGNRSIWIGEDGSFTIPRARLINGRWRGDEISITGAEEITVSVGETTPGSPPDALEIPVFDGRESVGMVTASCPGVRESWIMSCVHILLPDPDAIS
jgi:hypothetical protein